MSHLDDLFGRYPETLTIDELAEVLGVTRQSAYRWLQQGLLPGYKIGRSWVIYRDEVKEHMAQERAERAKNQASLVDEEAVEGD